MIIIHVADNITHFLIRTKYIPPLHVCSFPSYALAGRKIQFLHLMFHIIGQAFAGIVHNWFCIKCKSVVEHVGSIQIFCERPKDIPAYEQ